MKLLEYVKVGKQAGWGKAANRAKPRPGLVWGPVVLNVFVLDQPVRHSPAFASYIPRKRV